MSLRELEKVPHREGDSRKESHFWPGRGVFLFPGQGTQFVGMGRELFENSRAAHETFREADEILEFPLSTLCFNGPEAKLSETPITQLSTGLVCIAAYRALVEKYPQIEEIPPVVGFGTSFGEWTSLVPAGVIDFKTFLLLTRERGHIMDEVGKKNPGRMATILRLSREQVEEICKEYGVYLAINAPRFITISGSSSLMDEALSACVKEGGRVIDNVVNYPFHTPLMEDAENRIKKALSPVAFRDPIYPIILSRTARATRSGKVIKERLPEGITNPVDSTPMITEALSHGGRAFFELCPKPVLSAQLKREDKEIVSLAIHDKKSLEDLELYFCKAA